MRVRNRSGTGESKVEGMLILPKKGKFGGAGGGNDDRGEVHSGVLHYYSKKESPAPDTARRVFEIKLLRAR